MRRAVLLFAIVFLCASPAWSQSGRVVKIIKPTKTDVSAPLSEMVKKSQALAKFRGQEREIPNIFSSSNKRSSKNGPELNIPDALLHDQQPGGDPNAVTVALNFAGASNADNQAVVGGRVAPPDPNMDVGPNHIVQSVNLVSMIWNKTGTTLQGPFATSDLWTGFGGPCELNNDGDPIVLYDHLADRWLISQFVFSTDQCVCISTTSDPTGSYYRYQFTTPGNDYPKLGVMADAYYATIRNFSVSFSMDAAAMDRAKMLVGDPSATIQIFNLSALNPDVEGFIPTDLDGPAPPAGTPGFIVGHNGGPTLVHNELEVYKLNVDFATPSNSSLSLASTIPVSQFDLTVSTVPQPSPGPALQALANFTMHRATIRDFGSGQNFRMALTHTVDANGANRAGVRWYEVRDNTRTGNSWTLYQQGTHSPDATHRWMPSIAMNANGDIGLSYSASSSSVFPSIRATGRLAGDPLGTLQAETTVIAGTGAQTGTNRWGDYSALAVDPSNNTTFVGNHEYVITTGNFNWWTRIFSFNVTGGGGGGWQTITYDDFESGMGSYTDGGADMSRYTGSTHAHQPVAAADIQDNSGTASSFYHTGSYNVTAYNTLEVNFWFKMVSMESGEDFWVQYSSNNGSTWQTVATFARGATYANNTFYNAVVTLTPATVTFSTTAKLRFICDASDNNDDVYIDEILFRGNSAAAPLARNGSEILNAVAAVPEDFQLYQNYPNPFNPSTRIRFDLPQAMEVKLTVFNTLGEEVATLVRQYHEAGTHEVEWNGRLASGMRASSGIYVYRLQGQGLNLVRKMTLLQ